MFSIEKMKEKRDTLVAQHEEKKNVANVKASEVDIALEEACHADMALTLIKYFEQSLVNNGSTDLYSVGHFQVYSTTNKCGFIDTIDFAEEYKKMLNAGIEETRHTRLLNVFRGATYTVGLFLKDEFIQKKLAPAFKNLGVSLSWKYKVEDVTEDSDYDYSLTID